MAFSAKQMKNMRAQLGLPATAGAAAVTAAVGAVVDENLQLPTAVAFSGEQVKTLRARLELPETADAAAIVAAVDAVVEDSLEALVAIVPSAPAALPAGMVAVEADVLESLRRDASAGRTARRDLDAHTRDSTIAAAIAAGKTTPARREHWEAAWTADPEGAKAQLDALAPDLVPVTELGHDQTSTVASSAYDELYGSSQKGA